MANGAAKGILQYSKDIFGQATPENKLAPTGMLAYLLAVQQSNPIKIKYDVGNGHRQSVTVVYRKRLTKYHTSTAYDCDETNMQVLEEQSVSVGNYRQIAIGLNMEDVRVLESFASNPNGLDGYGRAIMQDLWNRIMTATTGLIQGINEDLVGLAAAEIGKNAANGLTSKTLNLPLDATKQPLNNGITEYWEDWKKNQFTGTPDVIGAGLFSRYMLQQGAKSADQSGLNSAVQAAGIRFWYDSDVDTLATNQTFTFERGAISLVPYYKNRGQFAGKIANSTFFTFQAPVMTYDRVGGIITSNLELDAQIKEYDCHDNIPKAYGEGSNTMLHGQNLILGLNFGIHTIPSTAYEAFDPLTGNRGSLKHVWTNTCDECPE